MTPSAAIDLYRRERRLHSDRRELTLLPTRSDFAANQKQSRRQERRNHPRRSNDMWARGKQCGLSALLDRNCAGGKLTSLSPRHGTRGRSSSTGTFLVVPHNLDDGSDEMLSDNHN